MERGGPKSFTQLSRVGCHTRIANKLFNRKVDFSKKDKTHSLRMTLFANCFDSCRSESRGYDAILHQTHQIVKVSDKGRSGRRFTSLLIYGPSRQHLKVGIFYSPLRERLMPMSSSSIRRLTVDFAQEA